MFIRIVLHFISAALLAIAADAVPVAMEVSPTTIRTTADIIITLETTFEWQPGEIVTILLPRFTNGPADGTDGESKAMGEVHITSSIWFAAAWEEGVFNQSDPYAESRLLIQNLPDGQTWPIGSEISITVLKHNKLKAFCGFESNWDRIQLLTPAADVVEVESNQVGDGCKALSNCGAHGVCNYCYEVCECGRGWGHPEDLALAPYASCQGRTCPIGYGLSVQRDEAGFVHPSECSGQGICDYRFGLCNCFTGFAGVACEQRACPNDCSGHGECVTMREAANRTDALPLSDIIPEYTLKDAEMPWDWDVMRMCVCDSSWKVGLGPGETQEPEWFGPDCSRRRCPSGDDPSTLFVDETDCSGKLAEGGKGIGKPNNKCHVDCSNRGVCDHNSGQCTCADGFLGENCGTLSPFAGTATLNKMAKAKRKN